MARRMWRSAAAVWARPLSTRGSARRIPSDVEVLDLSASDRFMCTNLMCEHVGERCACKAAVWFENADLPSLRALSLAGNDLRAAPPSVFLPTLVELDLSRNLLEALPAAVANATALEVLDVSDNEIEALPGALFGLTRLREVFVGNNAGPLAAPPGWGAVGDRLVKRGSPY